MRQVLFLFIILVFVAGCGGGSGDSNIETTQEPLCPENVGEYSYQDQSSWQYVEELCDNGSVVSYSCQRKNGGIVAFDSGRLNQVCEYLGEQSTEPSTEEIPEGATSYECPNKFDFSGFLYDTLNGEIEIHHASGVSYTPGENQIARFNTRPELGIAEGTTNFQENALRIAIGTINGALPDEYDIRILPNKVQARQGQPPSGSIYVDFAPINEWTNYDPNSAYTSLGTAVHYNKNSTNRSSHVWINSEETEHFSQKRMLWLIYHELFHALGFSRHARTGSGSVGTNFFHYNSVLWRIIPKEGVRLSVGKRRGNSGSSQFVSQSFQFRENGILYPVDWWGLKYLYEELETGDSTEFYLGPNDLTYPEFDDWLREKDCLDN